MTVTLPPTTGKADWTDYQDYWRDADAEWLQARTILRYATSAARTTDWGTPSPGHTTYNQATDSLEYYTVTAPAKWIPVLASQHLKVTPITSAADADAAVLGHKSASGSGLQFFPTVSSESKIALNGNAFLDVGGGKIILKGTGLTINTGATVAVLTTDADALVSSVRFEAPTVAVTTLAATGTATLQNISMAGTLSGGGIVNGGSGTIGGINLGAQSVNLALASAGWVSQAGIFFGTSTLAKIRQRDTASPYTLGTAGFDISDTVISAQAAANFFDSYAQFRIRGTGKGIQFYNDTPTYLGSVGPVVVSAAALTAANYPEGTIWIDT